MPTKHWLDTTGSTLTCCANSNNNHDNNKRFYDHCPLFLGVQIMAFLHLNLSIVSVSAQTQTFHIILDGFSSCIFGRSLGFLPSITIFIEFFPASSSDLRCTCPYQPIILFLSYSSSLSIFNLFLISELRILSFRDNPFIHNALSSLFFPLCLQLQSTLPTF